MSFFSIKIILLILGGLFFNIHCSSAQQDRIWLIKDYARLEFRDSKIFSSSNANSLPFTGIEANACISDSLGVDAFISDYCSDFQDRDQTESQICFGDSINDIFSKERTNRIKDAKGIKLQTSSTNGASIVTIEDDSLHLYSVFTHYYNYNETANPADTLEWDSDRGLYWHRISRDLRYPPNERRKVMTKKNVLLYKGVLCEKVLPIRHANGKDWWIITHRLGNNEFLLFRTDKDSAYFSHSCRSGSVHSYFYSPNRHFMLAGEITASYTNSPLVGLVTPNGLAEVFTFDRTNGLLNLHKTINTEKRFLNLYGCALSPDGTKFYYSTFISGNLTDAKLYQYDLEASENPETNIAEFAGDQARFAQMHVSPNNDLLIGGVFFDRTPDSITISLAGIQNPNEAGKKCNFRLKY